MDELQNLRRTIDLIDQSILQSFASRMQIATEIGNYKKNNQLPVEDTDREQQMQEKWIQEGQKYGLSKEFISELLALTLKTSKENQS